MLNLTVAVTRNPRFEPLMDGSVASKNLNLQFVVTTPPELFYRNLKYDEFEVFEMSLSELIITKERDNGRRWQWSALPVFPSKALVWLGLFVNSETGIRSLADFRGKRVGVPDYVMTAALWFRSFLKELHGIEPADVFWYVGRAKQFSHGAILGFDRTLPPGVSLTWLAEEQTFDRMLDRGELDAAYGFAPRHDPKLQTFGNIDRYGGTPIAGNPRLSPALCRRRASGGDRLFRKNENRSSQSHDRGAKAFIRGASLGSTGALQAFPGSQGGGL